MASQTFLGNKIRRLRKERSLTQVQLAEKLSISASYLNLIERNQRAMTVPLLLKLAEIFHLDLRTFAEDDEAQLVADLKEAFADGVFAGEELRPPDAQELAIGSPHLARAVLRLYRAYRKAREDSQTLAAHGAGEAALFGTEAVRLPSEEVSDVIQENMNYFPDLEDAAEELAREAKIDPADLHGGLLRHLEKTHRIRVETVNADQLEGAVRRYFPKRRRLVLSEVLSSSSQTFQVAHQIGLLTLGADPRSHRRVQPHVDGRVAPALPHRARELLCGGGGHALRPAARGGGGAALRSRAARASLSYELRAGRASAHVAQSKRSAGRRIPLGAHRHRRKHLQAIQRLGHSVRALLGRLSALERARRISHARA